MVQMRSEGRQGSSGVAWTMIVMILIASVLSGGCVNKILRNSADNATADSLMSGNSTTMNATPDPAGPASGSRQEKPVAILTPAKSDIVTEVTPFLTPDPYPILHGTRINETPLLNRLDRPAEFEKTYAMGGNATGLLVNVVEGPLYIVYEVSPRYDCLKNPDSCRGTTTAPVNRPYLTITVRDNATQEIVAEDGYGRVYSSDIGHYEITITDSNADGSSTTTTGTPGPRYIAIYKEGVYQITMEGNFLDVTIRILTGASPSRLDTGNGDSASQAAGGQDDEGE